MKKPFKKIGKRGKISLDMPDNKNRMRVKSITYTKQGILGDDIKCPECEGDGHFLEDNTHARGGTMNPYLCDYCDGKGIIDESKVSDIKFDSEGKPIIIYKDIKGDEPYDSNRK